MSHLIWQESGYDHTLSFFSVPDTYGDYVTTVSCNETPMPKYLYSTFIFFVLFRYLLLISALLLIRYVENK